MTGPFRLALPIGCSLLIAAMAGCNSGSTDSTGRPGVSIDDLEDLHEETHVHAETYAEAVAELDRMRQQIEDGFAAKDLEAADEPMHKIDHVLEEVVELATKEEMPAEAIAAIGAAVQQIFDGLDKVHDTIHGGEGPDYPEVKDQIDSGMEVLKRYLSPGSAAQPEAGEADAPPADPAVE